MSDGEGGEGQSINPADIIRVAPARWEIGKKPDFEGHRFIGRDKDSERMDEILREIKEKPTTRSEYLDKLPKLIFDGSTLSDEKKLVYREVLEKATIGALQLEFKDNEKLMGLVDEINETKADNPNESLFLLIQTRLLDLADRPEDVKLNDQNLTDEEVIKAIGGLKFARDEVLVQAAKKAGIFRHKDPMSGEERGINIQISDVQEKYDYLEAMQVIDGLKSNPSELRAVETRRLNRSSPDFAGMSTAYISGALDQMELGLADAENQYFKVKTQAAESVGNTQEAIVFEQKAEEAKLNAEEIRKRIDLVGWGKARPHLKQDALDQLRGRKRKGQEVAVGSIELGSDAVLEQLKKMADFTEGQYRMALEQNRALLTGYEAVVHAIKQRAYMNPEQFDTSNPYWFRFEQEGISSEERERYQGVIRLFENFGALTYIKELTGAKTAQNWMEAQGARINREYFKMAWDYMPGFRMAALTMSTDLFENSDFFEGKLNFKDGKRADEDKEFNFQQFVLTEKGYKLLLDKKNIEAYRQKLTEAMTNRLMNAQQWKGEVAETRAKIDDSVLTRDQLTDEQKEHFDSYEEYEKAEKWARDHRLIDEREVAEIYKLLQTGRLSTEDAEQKINDLRQKGIRDLIQTSVYAADEMFFSTGAYDSADVYRQTIEATKEEDDPARKDYAVKLQESHTISDGVREFFSPGLKLKERLSARKRYENKLAKIQKIREDLAAGRITPNKLEDIEREVAELERTLNAERGYGGPLGEWVRENYSARERKTKKGTTFRDEFDKRERDYIPDRVFYSMLEMIDTGGQEYDDPQTGERKSLSSTSVADILIDNRFQKSSLNTTQKVKIRVEDEDLEFDIKLFDLTNNGRGNSDRVFSAIRAGEWWGYYWDLGSAVYSLEEHQTGGDPRKSRLSREAFLDKWIKVRGDAKLAPIYTDRAYLLGATALIMSPEKGFVAGQPETLLDIPESAYNAVVTSTLSDNRFFISPARRKDLYEAYRAKNVTETWNILYDIYIEGTLFAPRERTKRGISKRIAEEIIRFEEEQKALDVERKKRQQAPVTQTP